MTEFLDAAEMAKRIKERDNILILCHKNPDGDTLGCGSALCEALCAIGKNASVLCSDPIPETFSYMNMKLFQKNYLPDCVICVDIAGLQLFGDNNDVPEYTKHIDYCIDHHAGNSGYADFTLLDAKAAAAGELMLQVIQQLGAEVTPHIADCLYTAISTDTGCFKFPSTTARTHACACELMQAGADVARLNKLLFETVAPERKEAERIALNNLEYHLDGQCALIYLTRDEISQSGVKPSDLEDLTSLPLTIKGVKVGLTLRQQPMGSYRISIRTVEGVDACAIARKLGGGGHNRAAGCELEGNLENTKSAVIAEVESALYPETGDEEN